MLIRRPAALRATNWGTVIGVESLSGELSFTLALSLRGEVLATDATWGDECCFRQNGSAIEREIDQEYVFFDSLIRC
jgi:hypothetical protein